MYELNSGLMRFITVEMVVLQRRLAQTTAQCTVLTNQVTEKDREITQRDAEMRALKAAFRDAERDVVKVRALLGVAFAQP